MVLLALYSFITKAIKYSIYFYYMAFMLLYYCVRRQVKLSSIVS